MRYLQGKYRYFVKLGQDLTDSRKWYTGLGVRHTLEVRRKISIKRDSKYASTGFICKKIARSANTCLAISLDMPRAILGEILDLCLPFLMTKMQCLIGRECVKSGAKFIVE